MGLQQVGKIVGELLHGQCVNLMPKILARPAHGEGIGLYRFGLHAVELEAFEVSLIILLEILDIRG